MSDSLPLIWTEGETPPAAPAGYRAKGVSQNRLSAASHQDKNYFCCRVLMHGAMSLMSSWCHFCVRDGDGKGFSDNHRFDYLEAGPEGVGLSPQRRSAPLQAVSRTSLNRNYQLNPERSVSAQSSPSRSEVKKPSLFTF